MADSSLIDFDTTSFFEENDPLFNLIGDNQFLQYEHKIKQAKTSRFLFPSETKRTDVTGFSDFGLDVIRDFLHIGLVNADRTDKRCTILLMVWPTFVSPAVYEDSETHLSGIKKLKTLIFYVPEDVYRQYDDPNVSPRELLIAASVLTPLEKWKYLESQILNSFFNLIFDQDATESSTYNEIWKNYASELDKRWKQLLFICCGPHDVAFYLKKILKRNSSRIARKATSAEEYVSNEYEVFCEGDIFSLIIQWAKYSMWQEGLLSFLKEVNINKPVLKPKEILEKTKISFTKDIGNVKRHRCQECPFATDHKGVFNNHLKIHSGEKPFVCEVCGRSFSISCNLKTHSYLHSRDYKHQCKFCGKQFQQQGKWRIHIARHEKMDQMKFKCFSCKRLFQNETDLAEHMPSHEKDPKFQCLVCFKWFDAESKLKEHMEVHSKNKEYKCQICGKEFHREGYLIRHAIVHSDPSFECDYCGKAFRHNNDRMVHQLLIHEQNNRSI